jgi:hypothetical protein
VFQSYKHYVTFESSLKLVGTLEVKRVSYLPLSTREREGERERLLLVVVLQLKALVFLYRRCQESAL